MFRFCIQENRINNVIYSAIENIIWLLMIEFLLSSENKKTALYSPELNALKS